MKYQEIKKQKENMMNQLITDCRVFFAFSDSQYEEGKKKIAFRQTDPEEKLVRIFGGGLMPSQNVKKFQQGIEDMNKWERSEIKKHKQADEQIKYELYNHECFYTGDPSTVFSLLPYTQERILNVYRSERKNAMQQM